MTGQEGEGEGEVSPHDATCCGGLCQKSCCTNYVKRRLPVVTWLPQYDPEKGRGDAIAGTTVGLMVVPQGLAYAITAGLPAVYGLYSAYVGVWIYILLGTSKDISVGPTAIVSSLVASTANGDISYAICLSLVAGLYMLILGLLHFGWVMWLISYPTLAAFTTAAAIRIAAGELGDLFGVSDWSSDFVGSCYDLVTRFDEISWTDTLLGVVCILLLLLLWMLQRYSAERGEKELSARGETATYYMWRGLWYVGLTRNIIIVCSATLLDYLLYKDDSHPFVVVGFIQPGLQKLDLTVFDTFASRWESLLIDGLVIALIALLESLAIGQTFSKKNKYSLDNSQEMVALGLCNIIGSLFLCYPVTGSFSRTSVNNESGVRTPFGGFYTGSIVVMCLLFLTSFFYYIPMSALAAVIIFAVVFMMDFTVPVALAKVRYVGTASWIVTFLCVLLLGIEYGICIGVVFDLCVVVARALRPETHVHDMGGGVVLVEVESGWNYLNVSYVRERAEEAVYWGRKRFLFSHSDHVEAIVLDAARFGELDSTALEAMRCLAEDCAREHITLLLAGLFKNLESDLKEYGVKVLNFASVDEAISVARREVEMAAAIRERTARRQSGNYGSFPSTDTSLTMRTAPEDPAET